MQYDFQKSQHQVEKLINRINEISNEKGGAPPTASAAAKTNIGSSTANPQVYIQIFINGFLFIIYNLFLFLLGNCMGDELFPKRSLDKIKG